MGVVACWLPFVSSKPIFRVLGTEICADVFDRLRKLVVVEAIVPTAVAALVVREERV